MYHSCAQAAGRPRGGEERLDDIKQGVKFQTYLEVVSPTLPEECIRQGGLGETSPPSLVLLLLLVSIPHLQKQLLPYSPCLPVKPSASEPAVTIVGM